MSRNVDLPIFSIEGKDTFAAVTQFEAADARRCFPCWDEPSFKATFDVTVIADPKKTVLSNMPRKSELPYEKDKSLSMIRFDTSPKVSTYLVAVVVGEFDYVEDTSADGVKVRVYTPLGKKEQKLCTSCCNQSSSVLQALLSNCISITEIGSYRCTGFCNRSNGELGISNIP